MNTFTKDRFPCAEKRRFISFHNGLHFANILSKNKENTNCGNVIKLLQSLASNPSTVCQGQQKCSG